MASQRERPQQDESRSRDRTSASTGLTGTPSGPGANAGFPIERHQSIYSLTLDEFQSALGEPGKNCGFMNMDEFLRSVWTAEECQAMAAAMGVVDEAGGSLGRQRSLQRQGSLSLPSTLSGKTVDDVRKYIYRLNMDAGSDAAASAGKEPQATLGEMTLEDFLVKAGVVKEDDSGSQSLVRFGADFEGDFGAGGGDKSTERLALGSGLGVNFGERGSRGRDEEKHRGTILPTLFLSPANVPSGQAALESMQLDPLPHASPAPQQTDWLTHQYINAMPQQHQHQNNILQQQAAYANAAKRVGDGALVGPAMGGPGTVLGPTAPGLKTGSPSSPVSVGVQPSRGYFSTMSPLPSGLDGTSRGRKRSLERSLEKVVERRQRRMIKNRESAARSRARARKQVVLIQQQEMQTIRRWTITMRHTQWSWKPRLHN